MNRNPYLLICAFAASSITPSSLSAELPDLSGMNILFLCPEDWSAEAIGAYGNEQVLTPHLDSFAETATLFTKAYTQNPVCNPSRSSFLTGLRPYTTRVFSNPDTFEEVIPEWATTIPETLENHPIKTYMVGKLFHHNWEAVEQASAFDGIFGDPPQGYQGRVIRYRIPAGTPPNPPRTWTHAPEPEWEARMTEAMKVRKKLWAENPQGSDLWEKGREVFQDLEAELVGDSGDIEERNPDGIRARVVANLLREHAESGEQFFITFGSSRPHTPLTAPGKYFDLYDPGTLRLTKAPEELDRNIPPVAKRFGNNWDIFKIREETPEQARKAIHAYYACATFIDDQIGLILDALEETGLADNTIVIFTSDHGFHLGEHGMWSKISLFEQVTRVPFIVRIPGVTRGATSDGIIELVDLYPTLCEILGLDLPHDKLEGISFLPLIEQPDRNWKKAAFTTCRHDRFFGKSIRTDSHRYTEWIHYQDRFDEKAEVHFAELYNLDEDPYEQNNPAGIETHRRQQNKMATMLRDGWERSLPNASLADTGESCKDHLISATSMRVEAEKMNLENYEIGAKGETDYIQLVGSKGVAEVKFPYSSGRYDIDARYLSESLGQNTYTMYLEGVQIIAWLGKDQDDQWHRIHEQKWHRLQDIEIRKGDSIRIESHSENGSLAILDYLEFTPAKESLPELRKNLITVYPEPYPHAIKNPLKGFRPEVDMDHEYGTLSKVYIRWNEIENTLEDGVDKIIAVSNEKWAHVEENNRKVIPRVYLDWPGRESGWPVDMIEGDYRSDHFKERVINLIGKMGQAWDEDSRVAYVEMGLIGEWGEMEWPDTRDDIKESIAAKFAKSFPNKIVMIRWPNTYNDDIYNFGYYWDSFAHHDQKYYAYHLKKTSPRWKTAPIGGETAYNWGNVKIQPGQSPEASLSNEVHRKHIIDEVRRLHANHLGWISDYDHEIESVRMGAEMLQKALGYRFVISEFTYPKSIDGGERFTVSFKVRNEGSSPFYYRWPVELSLLDSASMGVVWKAPFPDVDIRDWLPGDKWDPERQAYKIPAEEHLVSRTFLLDELPPGEYVVAISILDPAGMRPSVRFAINNYTNGGRHPIGRVGINRTIEAFQVSKFDDPKGDDSISYER